MHAALVHRADQLEGCAEGSLEEQELAASSTPSRATGPSAARKARCRAARAEAGPACLYSLNKTRAGIARFFRVSHNGTHRAPRKKSAPKRATSGALCQSEQGCASVPPGSGNVAH